MTQKLTILFDLDGTLIDTAPDLMNAHNHVMKKFGYKSRSGNEIKALIGKGAGVMIGRSLWNSAKIELKNIKEKKVKDEMVKEFVNFYGKNIFVESKLINGVEKFLKWCKDNNVSMGVCTNKQEHLAIDLLKKIGINNYFEFVAGCNTFDYCKPDARHLTNVIEIMKGDIKKSIMIGDSEVDAQSAQNASLPFVLLKDGYTDKNVNEIQHDHLIEDYINFEIIVKKYL
ncbi:MAG: phosphoglycolate phosphatase [Pelagibacterales bacterium]|nr:phosphoglycolate phosphatase [Pelagibacterales bacterium]